jgi:hypothetical protein
MKSFFSPDSDDDRQRRARLDTDSMLDEVSFLILFVLYVLSHVQTSSTVLTCPLSARR